MRTPRLFFVLASIVALFTTASCDDDAAKPPASTPTLNDLTVARVYSEMDRAFAGSDSKIAHVSIAEEMVQGRIILDGAYLSYAEDIWIDPAEQVARVETRVRYHGEAADRITGMIVAGDTTLRVDDEGLSSESDSFKCPGTDSAIIAQLMQCQNRSEESATRVELGTYDQQPSIVLITTGTWAPYGWTTVLEYRLYLGRSTFLPLASELRNARQVVDTPRAVALVHRYTTEFLDRAALPKDHFTPGSIGYRATQPAESLPALVDGVQLYWLGVDLESTARRPILRFVGSEAPVQTGYTASPAAATLEYRADGVDRNRASINLHQFDSTGWIETDLVGVGSPWADATKEEFDVPLGRAVLFRIRGKYDIYFAHVYFDTTVVLITHSDEPSPISNREAFIEIIKGLQPIK